MRLDIHDGSECRYTPCHLHILFANLCQFKLPKRLKQCVSKQRKSFINRVKTTLILPLLYVESFIAESGYRWMFNNRKVLWGKTLDDITIPGTHDTGAYDMNSRIMPGSLPETMIKMLEWLKRFHMAPSPFLIKWAETQRKTVTEQLNDGIRFLDLRAGTL